MKCPFCSHMADKVVDSREVHEGSVIRRRRECLGCARRFTTYERTEEIAYMIVKKDGRRERFDRQKLLKGLLLAAHKRPVSPTALEAIVNDVENQLQERPEREMMAGDVGEYVMGRLKDQDQVAYVRFASVYRRFEDVQEFLKELHGLLKKKES